MEIKCRLTTLRACTCACMLWAWLSVAHAAEQTATESGTSLSTWQDLSARASELAMRAMGLVGIRYKYGGTVPESGLDCSGFVRYMFREVWGTELPRTSEEISRVGERVNTNELQPGDLVFYNTLRRSFSHVGIYLGENRFIHAASRGGQVRVENMDAAYWKKRFNGARRISQAE